MPCPSYPNLCFWTVAQTARVTPLGIGPPGCGKSASIRAFSQALGRYHYVLVGSLLQPTDMAIPYPDGEQKDRLLMLVADWCHNFRLFDGGVLLLDELTQCAPAQQTAMMKVIHDRKVGDMDLPEDLFIVAACNPPECAANGSELEPPLANRLCHLQWETDYEGWERAMTTGAKFDPPRFVPLPDTWEQHLPKYSALVAAFHKHLPGRLEQYPKERSKVSGPWPSMRSWTNGAVCMAALAAIDAEPCQRYKALAGCIGSEVALEYQEWESKLDLPDPEAWLGVAADWRRPGGPMDSGAALTLDVPDRGDKVMAVLAGVVDRVKNHSIDSTTGRISEGRWLAGIDCCVTVAESWREAAMLAATSLLDAVKAKGPQDAEGKRWFLHLVSKLPSAFAQECGELLVALQKA